MRHDDGLVMHDQNDPLWIVRSIARAISLCLALTGLVIVVMMPHVANTDRALAIDALLPILILALIGALTYSIGYRPHNVMAAAMTGPLVCWPVIIAALVLVTFKMH